MNQIRTGIVKVIRSIGQALDSLGQKFEVYPHIEKCKFACNLIFRITFYFFSNNYIELLLRTCSTTVDQNRQVWQK